jgi:enterochelin esterase-like enzyme
VTVGRRAFVAGLFLTGCSDCARREASGASAAPASAPAPPPVAKALPPMPDAGEAPAPRGKVGTQTWSFDGGGRAVAVVPAWLKPGERLPLLVALHGRGEAQKDPAEGAMGWPRDYALLRAIERLCAPPITDADLEGFSDPKRLAALNDDLAKKRWEGLVVVCPYTPDLELRKPAEVREYGEYLIKTVIPRARKELPVFDSPGATGIDGVSLGGAIALRVGLENAHAFGAVGTLQAAIGEDQVPEFTELAKQARVKNPDVKLRLLTSSKDYFREAITALHESWRAAGIAHDFADVPGPHDYPFNRGPGAIEMLVWHDRMLARGGLAR